MPSMFRFSKKYFLIQSFRDVAISVNHRVNDLLKSTHWVMGITKLIVIRFLIRTIGIFYDNFEVKLFNWL